MAMNGRKRPKSSVSSSDLRQRAAAFREYGRQIDDVAETIEKSGIPSVSVGNELSLARGLELVLNWIQEAGKATNQAIFYRSLEGKSNEKERKSRKSARPGGKTGS